MNIDKNRFLLLTTTLAATAAAALVVPTSGCTTTNNTTTDAGPNTVLDSSTPGDDDDAATGDGGSDGGLCLANKRTTPVFCAPSGEGTDPDAGDAGDPAAKCPAECDFFSQLMKTDVAQDIKECMDLAPTCEGTAPACVEKALDKGCEDSTAVSFCADLVKCGVDGGVAPPLGDGGTSAKECERIARSLNATGRTELKTCVDNFTAGGIGPCDEGGQSLQACYDAVKSGEAL